MHHQEDLEEFLIVQSSSSRQHVPSSSQLFHENDIMYGLLLYPSSHIRHRLYPMSLRPILHKPCLSKLLHYPTSRSPVVCKKLTKFETRSRLRRGKMLSTVLALHQTIRPLNKPIQTRAFTIMNRFTRIHTQSALTLQRHPSYPAFPIEEWVVMAGSAVILAHIYHLLSLSEVLVLVMYPPIVLQV